MGRINSGDPPPETVVAELEGTLLKDPDLFSYFMLMALEASGLVRFTMLLMEWSVVCMLDMAAYGNAGLQLAVFVAVAGVKMAEVEAVFRAVLPKFFMENVRLEAWRVFQFGERRVVVSVTGLFYGRIFRLPTRPKPAYSPFGNTKPSISMQQYHAIT